MARGTATRVRLNGSPATNLASEILDLGSHEALVLGDLADGLPDKIKLEKDEIADPARGTTGGHGGPSTIGRASPPPPCSTTTRRPCRPTCASGLDDVGGFEGALALLIPATATLARVVRASTSAGILQRRDRRALSRQRRAARLRLRRATARTSRASSRRCRSAPGSPASAGSWSARAGQLLVRSIVDTSVGLPERLVFEGPPLVVAPLAQDHAARQPVAHEGDLLDTRAACPPLTRR